MYTVSSSISSLPAGYSPNLLYSSFVMSLSFLSSAIPLPYRVPLQNTYRPILSNLKGRTFYKTN